MIKRDSRHADGADRPSPDTVSANGQQPDASSEKPGLAILLIDDRPEVATAMEIAFRMAGHSLTVAPDPQEAFSQLARTQFDGIVLDLNFTPGKSDGKLPPADALPRARAKSSAADLYCWRFCPSRIDLIHSVTEWVNPLISITD